MKGNIFDVQRNSFVDGPGIRTTVFFKGCDLRCLWCHNPESQSEKKQIMFHATRCVGCGKCKEICPNDLSRCDLCGACVAVCENDAREMCGREYGSEELLKIILRDKIFYESSGGGVTFSGGECMLQIDFLVHMAKLCKNEGIHVAIDTAGHLPYEYFERILPYADLFLYDIKCIDREKHKKYTGVSNELIINNFKKLSATDVPIWVRIPVVSGVNDDPFEMKRIKELLTSCKYPERVELLPYHAMGEGKYAAIGKEPIKFSAPPSRLLEELKSIF